MTKKTENRGGPRVAGPGKKNGRPFGDKPPKIHISCKLDPLLMDYLNSLGKGNKSPEIERLIRSSRGFRTWKREQAGT